MRRLFEIVREILRARKPWIVRYGREPKGHGMGTLDREARCRDREQALAKATGLVARGYQVEPPKYAPH